MHSVEQPPGGIAHHREGYRVWFGYAGEILKIDLSTHYASKTASGP